MTSSWCERWGHQYLAEVGRRAGQFPGRGAIVRHWICEYPCPALISCQALIRDYPCYSRRRCSATCLRPATLPRLFVGCRMQKAAVDETDRVGGAARDHPRLAAVPSLGRGVVDALGDREIEWHSAQGLAFLRNGFVRHAAMPLGDCFFRVCFGTLTKKTIRVLRARCQIRSGGAESILGCVACLVGFVIFCQVAEGGVGNCGNAEENAKGTSYKCIIFRIYD